MEIKLVVEIVGGGRAEQARLKRRAEFQSFSLFSQILMAISFNGAVGNGALLSAFVFLTCSVALFPPKRRESCGAAASAPGVSLEIGTPVISRRAITSVFRDRRERGSRCSGCRGVS